MHRRRIISAEKKTKFRENDFRLPSLKQLAQLSVKTFVPAAVVAANLLNAPPCTQVKHAS